MRYPPFIPALPVQQNEKAHTENRIRDLSQVGLLGKLFKVAGGRSKLEDRRVRLTAALPVNVSFLLRRRFLTSTSTSASTSWLDS